MKDGNFDNVGSGHAQPKLHSCQESNPRHLACTASALPLTYDNWTTTKPHNSVYILHRWYRHAPVSHLSHTAGCEKCWMWEVPGVRSARCETVALQCHLCSIYRGLWGLVVVLLSQLSDLAEHWLHKPEVSWVWFLVTISLFAFLYFHLNKSNLRWSKAF